MRVTATLCALLALCLWVTDLGAPSTLHAILAPLAAGLLLIGLLLWLVLWAHRRGHSLGAPAHRQGAAGTVGGIGSSEGGGGGSGGGGGDAG